MKGLACLSRINSSINLWYQEKKKKYEKRDEKFRMRYSCMFFHFIQEGLRGVKIASWEMNIRKLFFREERFFKTAHSNMRFEGKFVGFSNSFKVSKDEVVKLFSFMCHKDKACRTIQVKRRQVNNSVQDLLEFFRAILNEASKNHWLEVHENF